MLFRESHCVHGVGEGQPLVQRHASHLAKVGIAKTKLSFVVFN